MRGQRHTIDIAAPPDRVWAVLVDVERWPQRIPTVEAADRLDPGPLVLGSRTRLKQPRLPAAVWTVTELTHGTSFTWESTSPGVRLTAGHVVEAQGDGTVLRLSLDLSGPLSGISWRLTRSLAQRYGEAEGASIKRVAETGAS